MYTPTFIIFYMQPWSTKFFFLKNVNIIRINLHKIRSVFLKHYAHNYMLLQTKYQGWTGT